MSIAQIFCNRCGAPSASDAAFCQNCGAGLTIAPGLAPPSEGSTVSPRYAGFWIRVPSALLDFSLLFVANRLVRMALYSITPAIEMDNRIFGHGTFGNRHPLRFAIALAIGWVYGAGMESSRFQASLGKMALHLKVTDEQGNRLTLARATARHFAKLLSVASLGIGYVMAGFDSRKQALHDQMAGTLVLYGDSSSRWI
jgi:uncharacterized RDD family membrane protein YckC